MTWRFTILHDNTETVIDDEPTGWDSISKTIQRDGEMHGMTFSFSQSSLEFIEDAYWIIKEKYISDSVDGDVGLRIEWMCDECDGYQFFYQGKLDFNSYKERCGDDCAISVGLEGSQAELLVKNRMEIAVDLTSNLAYDGVTELTDYNALGRDISLPGKAILIQSKAVNDKQLTSPNLRDDPQWGQISNTNQSRGQIYPGFIKTVLTDLSDTVFQSEIALLSGGALNRPSTGLIPIVDFKEFSTLPCVTSNAVLKYRFKGVVNTAGGPPNATFLIFKLPAGSTTDSFDYIQLASHSLGASSAPFDFSDELNIVLNVGDKIYCYIFFNVVFPSDYTSYVVTEDPECYFEISLHSLCDPSPVKNYFIHEAASRVFEHITDNHFKFKSEYYGRTDSQPYAFANNGCGGLRTLSNGLQIRRAVLTDNSNPKVFISPKDLFESLNAIDCIGMGIEGTDIVFEPIRYFYRDEIIFTADGVNEITTTVRNERIYNQFAFGYDKFETESTNGLDAIHTKRQYRLSIKNTDKKLEKYSKIITDPYAIEATRRKYGTTEDWRYDQNIFMLCCKRGLTNNIFVVTYGTTGVGFWEVHSIPVWAYVGAVLTIQATEPNTNAPIPGNSGQFTITQVELSNGYLFIGVNPGFIEQRLFAGAIITSDLLTDIVVDQGNITSAENIFDPGTVINYAVTPIRNALRWFSWVIQGIRDHTNAKLLFNSGEGNYVAKGLLNTGCIDEADVIAENEIIQASTFADANKPRPFIVPEKVMFTYPLGLNEFVSLAANKYGRIQYRRFDYEEWKYGWIDSIKYNPNDGDAEFTLITCKE